MNFQKNIFALLIIYVISSPFSRAQKLTQTIRGSISDKISQITLPGTNVVVMNSDPFNGTSTDDNGNFRLNDVPVGLVDLKITFLGYKEYILPNVTVTSGKEVVLVIALEENVIQHDEVIITDKIEKNKSLNEFSTVSARTFSVEETQKYAAAVNDPARTVLAYAGVVSTDDGNNLIAIRGNAPNGMVWKMEGVEIPNPNHFSGVGTSGGGISILSSQLLTNSDFITGAFAAEYGNAISGVFDMKLRKGNNQKAERTIQAGFLGTDLAIEGPFKKGYNGSYLVNYRYSTLSMLSKLGVEIGPGVTTFQDLSYNVFLPTNHSGNFSLFGFGGLSNQFVDATKDSADWESNYDRYNVKFVSNTGVSGLGHFIQLDAKTYVKSSLTFSGSSKSYSEEKIDDSYDEIPQGELKYNDKRLSLATSVTKKVNSQNSFKAGISANKLFYDYNKTRINNETNIIENELNQKGNTYTIQTFVQWNFRPTEKLTFNTGIHSIFLTDNKTYTVEPRASVRYEFSPMQSVSFGYGLHGQVQPMGVYYTRLLNNDGSYTEPNRNLGFTKAHHFVLGFDRSLNEFMRVKVETYYQYLFDVPVSTDPANTFSMLNNVEGFVTDPLVNNGHGKNYGVELTLEQFLHNDFYFLLSTSVYNSKYEAANKNWYNTRFNGNFSTSLTAGKDFKTGEKFGHRIIGINIKTIYSGGLRNTPIDYDASVANGETEYIDSRAYELQAKNYFRTDFKISVKRNRLKSTTTWSLDLQNASNHKNEYGEYFDPLTGKTKMSYQAPMIPVLSYRIDF